MHNRIVSIIGLGYVGLPVAVAFGRQQRTYGFDINESRLSQLRDGIDSTLEVTKDDLLKADIVYTSNTGVLANANFHIVAVPTPIDRSKKPDLTPLLRASESVGSALKKGDIVVYESTVYPGATEEECVPVLERTSGLVCGKDFHVGYSPERINPGDKEHTFTKITKVVSGQTDEILEIVAMVYGSVVTAGVHRAESIKVAEAAKVIENTQRDVNIALINELAVIFDRIKIDTEAVLKAAGTKWNFLPFRPGLVGGHCIGVDPYYLTHKAQQLGYHPEVILSGRRINDSMGNFVVQKLVKRMVNEGMAVNGANVLVLGLTFKENCPDLRNTRVIDILKELREYNMTFDVCDPWVSVVEAKHEYNLDVISAPKSNEYDAIILAVPHEQFISDGPDKIRQLGKKKHVFFDLKSCFQIDKSDLRI